MVGLEVWLAEKPEYETAAVSAVRECSYGVGRQLDGRFDKVQRKT